MEVSRTMMRQIASYLERSVKTIDRRTAKGYDLSRRINNMIVKINKMTR